MTPPDLPPSEEALRLVKHLERSGKALGPLLILTHDHPDPDALASAWALSLLAQKLCRVRVRIVYSGVVVRRENLFMMQSLWIPASPFRPSDLGCPHVALVDTQPPFRNNRFPAAGRPDIIIDHHPRHRETRAEFSIINEAAGATVTILAEALLAAGIKFPRKLATAVVYGIGAETQNLGREATDRDSAAYMAFLHRADLNALWRIANPPRPGAFFRTMAQAIHNAYAVKDLIGVHLREISSPDLVAQMADFLLAHETMRWSLVTGRYQGRLHISLRTNAPGEHAGRLLRTVLGGGTRAGGHQMMAGGSMDIGHRADEGLWREAEDHVLSAFLKLRGMPDDTHREYPFRQTT
ncbi:MAG: DHH family phosphoesterase [Elusimicrobiota bacterium]